MLVSYMNASLHFCRLIPLNFGAYWSLDCVPAALAPSKSLTLVAEERCATAEAVNVTTGNLLGGSEGGGGRTMPVPVKIQYCGG